MVMDNDTGLIQKDKQERLASAIITSEILSKLNISVETLPLKCQQTLRNAAQYQVETNFARLDPMAISLHQTRELSDKLQKEYEKLKLKQKDAELQARIDRNNVVLEGLRKELACARESLAMQYPNPDNIQEHIRQLKQKVTSYEESCEKAKRKFSKLLVPEELYPSSMSSLVDGLVALKAEAFALQQQAEDVMLAREARETVHKLLRR